MSGGTRGDIGPPRNPETPRCLEIYRSLPVYSPKEKVLGKLKAVDSLKFKLNTDNGNRSLHVLHGDEILGSVIHIQLINCIDQGYEYIPKIVSIELGSCVIDAEMTS